MTKGETKLRHDAVLIYRAALEAADAGSAIRRSLRLRLRNRVLEIGGLAYLLADFDRIVLIAVGKAAGAMALAVEDILGSKLTSGLVVTKHGHAVEGLRICHQHTAAHPIPDKDGEAASTEVESMLRELNARDLLLVAVSGGASALLPAPVYGVTLEAKSKVTSLLLQAGADITRLNTVRKRLSRFKGSGLAALAYPATVVGLLLSDVIGDSPSVIGSGLTAPDQSAPGTALDILDLYGLRSRVPKAVLRHLQSPATSRPSANTIHNVIVGSNRLSLNAAAKTAKLLGYRTSVLSSTVAGETRDAAAVLASILRETAVNGSPLRPPACLLAGGETTVTVRGRGRGGRNQEFALSAALSLAGLQDVLALSIGTDGTDGPTPAAGAIATGDTCRRAAKLGLDAADALQNNDSYAFFGRLNDLIVTGPTGTNVMDICVLLAAK